MIIDNYLGHFGSDDENDFLTVEEKKWVSLVSKDNKFT